MSEFFVASKEELELLTKRERMVYVRVRNHGMTNVEICEELSIKEETRRCHWYRAQRKILKFRASIESPVGLM